MKYAIFPAVIFSVFSLAACGGGGGDGSSSGGTSSQDSAQNPSGTPAATLVSQSQVIDYYGDSTIWGWQSGGNGARVATPAPAAFAAALPTAPAQTVNNLGVPGQTACQLLNGVNEPADWATLMQSSQATVVILNHGINDGYASDPTARESVADYKNCLTQLVQIAKTPTTDENGNRHPGKRVILETPNPISVQDEKLIDYVQAMRDVAAQEKVSVIDEYDYLTKLRESLQANGTYESQYPNGFTPDGLHPTEDIYIKKVQYAASVFKDLPL